MTQPPRLHQYTKASHALALVWTLYRSPNVPTNQIFRHRTHRTVPVGLGADGGGANEVRGEDSLLGVHRWLRAVIDGATMNALFDQKAKLISERQKRDYDS